MKKNLENNVSENVVVIDRVILDRPSRNLLNIEIHCKDHTVKKILMDTFRREIKS